jgi:hypothetical protein
MAHFIYRVAHSAFVQAVIRRTKDLRAFSIGSCSGCSSCSEVNVYGHFSWSDCDSCGSNLGGDHGGDHYPAHYLDDDNEIVHCEICQDCLYYHAYGEEPEQWRARR